MAPPSKPPALPQSGLHAAHPNCLSSPLVQALVQQRAAAELEHAAAKEAGEAEAAARWQGRVTDLRKQVGSCSLQAHRQGTWRFAQLLRMHFAVPRVLNLPA